MSLFLLHLKHHLCRGDNGELRVGVKRVPRQQSTMPQSVISSQSMHLGVLATASHAVMTNTLFTVYYKPRFKIFLIFQLSWLRCVIFSFNLQMPICCSNRCFLLTLIKQDKSIHCWLEQVP